MLCLLGKGAPPLDLGGIVHPPWLLGATSLLLQYGGGARRGRLQCPRHVRHAFLQERRAFRGWRWTLLAAVCGPPGETGLGSLGEQVIADRPGHLIEAAEGFGDVRPGDAAGLVDSDLLLRDKHPLSQPDTKPARK